MTEPCTTKQAARDALAAMAEFRQTEPEFGQALLLLQQFIDAVTSQNEEQMRISLRKQVYQEVQDFVQPVLARARWMHEEVKAALEKAGRKPAEVEAMTEFTASVIDVLQRIEQAFAVEGAAVAAHAENEQG